MNKKQGTILLALCILTMQLRVVMAQEDIQSAKITEKIVAEKQMLEKQMLMEAVGETKGLDESKINDSELKAAIIKIKGKFDVPERLTEFSYHVQDSKDITYWQLSWRDKDYSEMMEIRYGSDGNVYQYYYYDSEVRHSDKKKPYVVTRENAKKTADAFLKTTLPDEHMNFKEAKNEQNYDYGNHSIRYQYFKNGILVEGADAFVNVNAITGAVTHYSTSAIFSLDYPDNDKVIGKQKAEEAYKSEIGLRLAYRSKIKYDKDGAAIERIYPVYVPRHGYEYGIDAISGKRISLLDRYIHPYAKDVYGGGREMMNSSYAMEQKVNLLPSEENAIKGIEGIIPKDEALKKVQEKGIPGFDKEYKLTSSNLSKGYLFTKDSYIWSFNYTKGNEEEGKTYENIYVSMDAQTGEILSFGANNMLYDSRKGEGKLEDIQKEAESFLKAFVGEKFSQTVYEPEEQLYEAYKAEAIRFLRLTYYRKVNGVIFPDNNISITYDTLLKRVTNYSLTWYEVEFPPVDKVANLDDIYSKLFTENPIELQYRIIHKFNDQKEIFLIYNPKGNKIIIFDANTGSRLDYNGDDIETAKPQGSIEYTDIKGHFAEKYINDLAQIGIGLGGEKYLPNEEIAQKDLMLLISQSYSYAYHIMGEEQNWNDEKLDNMYKDLIRKGVILQNEKRPDEKVAREEAVKYLVRALGFSKIAEKSEIFVKAFTDSSEINTENAGFVAVAKALNIINGADGKFYPKRELTKGEAAVMIYNYLVN